MKTRTTAALLCFAAVFAFSAPTLGEDRPGAPARRFEPLDVFDLEYAADPQISPDGKAVVAKPVINWYSFVLTTDHYDFFYKYWFPGFPWDHPEHYLARSPLSLVGNVKTPTMLLTCESDYRTPMSESEQYYQALKLRKIDAVLVRVPGASHRIAARPSNLIAKVLHVLKWFETHRTGAAESARE